MNNSADPRIGRPDPLRVSFLLNPETADAAKVPPAADAAKVPPAADAAKVPPAAYAAKVPPAGPSPCDLAVLAATALALAAGAAPPSAAAGAPPSAAADDDDEFWPPMSRGGGNLSRATQSGRVLRVLFDRKRQLRLYEPKKSYKASINVLQGYIETLPDSAKEVGGDKNPAHPLLNIHKFCIPLALSRQIAQSMYGHRQTAKVAEKSFGQLLCYLGMRSDTDKKAGIRTLTFDPHGWNKAGYRLVKGGDTAGGRPTIQLVDID